MRFSVIVCINSTKGQSKNINIFMSVPTVHFLRPPPFPPSVQTNMFEFHNIGFTQHNI